MTLPLFGAAVVPTLLILWFFLARDRHPEPRAVLLRTFGLGVLSTLPAGLLELGLEAAIEPAALSPTAQSLTFAFFGAALCEELLKFWIVYGYCRRHASFDEPMDGIIYGVTASLGFATLENVLYVASNGMGVAIARALLAVPGHACWGALMGYYVGQAHFGTQQRQRMLALALGLPILLHGLYDFPILLLSEAPDDPSLALPWLWLPLAVLYGGWRLALSKLGELRALQLPRLPLAAPELDDDGQPLGLQQSRPSRTATKLLLLAGGVLAWWGGLVTLAVAAAALTDGTQGEELLHLVLGTTLIGVLPLVLGLWLFRLGILVSARRD